VRFNIADSVSQRIWWASSYSALWEGISKGEILHFEPLGRQFGVLGVAKKKLFLIFLEVNNFVTELCRREIVPEKPEEAKACSH
jgi:hypothetical protein